MSTNIRPTPQSCLVNSPGATGTRYNPQLLGGNTVVPYVASWTSEHTQDSAVVNRPGGGIAYRDETSVDRDSWGVLWVRTDSRIGVGRPLFKDLHPLRQRRAMLKLLCQVCAQPAGYTPQGHLWLLPGRDGAMSAEQLEDAPVTMPPVCVACARLSVRLCPALRSEYVAVRAFSLVCGVVGMRFQPGALYPRSVEPEDDPSLVFDHKDAVIRWVLAVHRVRTLHECVAVDLDRL